MTSISLDVTQDQDTDVIQQITDFQKSECDSLSVSTASSFQMEEKTSNESQMSAMTAKSAMHVTPSRGGDSGVGTGTTPSADSGTAPDSRSLELSSPNQLSSTHSPKGFGSGGDSAVRRDTRSPRREVFSPRGRMMPPPFPGMWGPRSPMNMLPPPPMMHPLPFPGPGMFPFAGRPPMQMITGGGFRGGARNGLRNTMRGAMRDANGRDTARDFGKETPRSSRFDRLEHRQLRREEEENKVSSLARPFIEATPTDDVRSSAPLRSFRTQNGDVTYPLIYVSPAGTISLLLSCDVIIETAVDRSVRVVCHDKFAAFVNSRGTASSILHANARILHTKESVYAKFTSRNEKMAVFGMQGVLFSMGHLTEAYLVSCNIKGASAVALDQLAFPPMENDYTIKLFYMESQTGNQFIPLCKDIVSEASYERRLDGTLVMHINGMTIRQMASGDVSVDARPRHITCSPKSGTVHVRSAFIDMAIQDQDKAFVKRGHKRVHVSCSGMVVSDGNRITSMDHFGRIVSCA